MVLMVLHISVAFTSLCVAGVSVFAPSVTRLRLAYGLIAATLLSGTVLVVSAHAPLASACVSGLLYLAVAGGFVALARKRLLN